MPPPLLDSICQQLTLLREEVRFVRDWMLKQQSLLDDRRRAFDRSIKLITVLLLTIAIAVSLR